MESLTIWGLFPCHFYETKSRNYLIELSWELNVLLFVSVCVSLCVHACMCACMHIVCVHICVPSPWVLEIKPRSSWLPRKDFTVSHDSVHYFYKEFQRCWHLMCTWCLLIIFSVVIVWIHCFKESLRPRWWSPTHDWLWTIFFSAIKLAISPWAHYRFLPC